MNQNYLLHNIFPRVIDNNQILDRNTFKSVSIRPSFRATDPFHNPNLNWFRD